MKNRKTIDETRIVHELVKKGWIPENLESIAIDRFRILLGGVADHALYTGLLRDRKVSNAGTATG